MVTIRENDLETETVLNEINKQLFEAIHESEDLQYQICWNFSAKLTRSIESDLTAITGGEPRVVTLGFKLADPYRQGADSYRAVIQYSASDDFEVVIDGCFDHGGPQVIVRKWPRAAEFDSIAVKLGNGTTVPLKSCIDNS